MLHRDGEPEPKILCRHLLEPNSVHVFEVAFDLENQGSRLLGRNSSQDPERPFSEPSFPFRESGWKAPLTPGNGVSDIEFTRCAFGWPDDVVLGSPFVEESSRANSAYNPLGRGGKFVEGYRHRFEVPMFRLEVVAEEFEFHI
ncbi:MAG TPA: hypothetical protein VJI33_04410 [Candidatus Paceibacterota bacterium]